MKKSARNLTIAFVVIGLVGFSHGIYAQETGLVGLDSFVRHAVEHNPQIQKAYYDWKAEEYKVRQAKSLPDPMVSYTNFGEGVQTRTGPQEGKYGFSQTIPFPGKLGLKGKAQAKQAQMLKEQYEATKNEVVKDIKFAYFDLFWVDKAIEVNEEEKSIMERSEKVAQRKYESNLVPQQDVIKAQVELSTIIKKLFLLRQNRQSLVAKMNSLLNRAQDTPIAKISDIEHKDFRHKLKDVLAKAQNSRQELIAAHLSVERAEFQESLARMDYLPDFTVGTEYIEIGGGTSTHPEDGDNVWMGMISVNVPVWFGRLKAQLDEKKAELEAAKKNEEDVENRVSFEGQDLYSQITTYKDIVSLYETALIPQAQQAFDASQVGFETGEVSFLDWLDTERTYLQTRLAYYKAITDYHKSIAFLERVVGEDL
jgi:outer membrane protein, heavy metal efflux system